jgi:hypothetical protein
MLAREVVGMGCWWRLKRQISDEDESRGLVVMASRLSILRLQGRCTHQHLSRHGNSVVVEPCDGLSLEDYSDRESIVVLVNRNYGDTCGELDPWF